VSSTPRRGNGLGVWIGVMATVVVALTGCTGTSSPSSASPSGNPGTSGSSAGGGPDLSDSALGIDRHLPLNGYYPSLEQTEEVSQARELLMAGCMEEAGYTFDPAHDSVLDPVRSRAHTADFGVNGNRRRYGVNSLRAARAYGLHLPSQIIPELRTNEATDRSWVHGFRNPSQSALKMMETCVHAADTKLGNVDTPALVAEAKGASFVRSTRDAKVETAFAQYRSCMRERGYSAAEDPANTGVAPGVDLEGPTVSVEERQLAVASAECQAKYDVEVIWYETEVKIQREFIEQHSIELAQIREDNAAMMKKVAAILEQGI
jgi:hypothetical protein